MLSILSSEKSFADRWIGHPGLNRHLALHRRRMTLAAACNRLRRRLRSAGDASLGETLATLDREGCVAIPQFLRAPVFARLSDEAERLVAEAAERAPIPENKARGFGAARPFEGGLDRFDGGTLNRFLHVDAARSPALAEFAADPRLSALSRSVVGRGHVGEKTQLYLTVNGDEAANPDIQRAMHRDTFFSSMKFWFFLRPVTRRDGPFEYVPGSHRLTPQRLAWEQAEADARTARQAGGDRGGAFRIAEGDLAAIGLPPPVAFACEANTLVIADTLGFHRRGMAEPGTERLSVYGWHRPYPFLPV